MELTVRVIEARNLPAKYLNWLRDPYVLLQIGRQRKRTRAVKKTLNPKWVEDFSFRVEDLEEELIVSVDDEAWFLPDDFSCQITFPVSTVFDADNNSLPSAWYPLHPKSIKSKIKECGEILLDIHFSQRNSYVDYCETNGDFSPPMKEHAEVTFESLLLSYGSPSYPFFPVNKSSKEDKFGSQKTPAGRIAQIFHKNKEDDGSSTSGREIDRSDVCETSVHETDEHIPEDQFSG